MLKQGILHPGLLSLLARCAHGSKIALVDSGFGIPQGPERVDLAFLPNIPTTLQVLDGVLAQFSIEKAIITQEIHEMAPEYLKEIEKRISPNKLEFIPWSEFKPMISTCDGVVRSGDHAVHAGNIILVGGCVY